MEITLLMKCVIAALQPLVPYLIRFASQQIYLNSVNLWTIELTLRMLKSLVKNQHLQLGVYSHHILPLILSCLLSESLGADLGVSHLSKWFLSVVKWSKEWFRGS